MTTNFVKLFIQKFQTPENKILFTKGHCLLFAKMLQESFQRGKIMVDVDANHIYWQDGELLYDIEHHNGIAVTDEIRLLDWERLDEDTKEEFRHSGAKALKPTSETLLEDIWEIYDFLTDSTPHASGDIAKLYRDLYDRIPDRDLFNERSYLKTATEYTVGACVLSEIYSKKELVMQITKDVANSITYNLIPDWESINVVKVQTTENGAILVNVEYEEPETFTNPAKTIYYICSKP